jgi:hypothetical protein
MMNTLEQQHFDYLYHQHLINLTLQGKRPATIDAYSRAVRRITAYFDRTPDTLSTNNLKQYFNDLIQTHSWGTVKIDRNIYGKHALQYLSRYLYRRVLPDKDITCITTDSVTFQYRDSETKQIKKTHTADLAIFIVNIATRST